MSNPQVVSHDEWQRALDDIPAEEKRETRRRDALADMFEGRRQLVLTRDDGEGFGLSVLVREDDRLLRTYFTGDRGVEALGSVWTFLDLTPFGRQEAWEDSPAGAPQESPYQWWRRHDEYEEENA
jgi:predicted dithiol-disulfide oxidoreductase (DUF899 family)